MEIKALCEPASHCLKQLGLGAVLHALADDRHSQFPCHLDQVSQHNLFPDPGNPVAHKASVQLEDICGQLLELSQGRIAEMCIRDRPRSGSVRGWGDFRHIKRRISEEGGLAKKTQDTERIL